LNGEDEELTSIISEYPFLVNLTNKDKKTPLHLAIKGNHLSTCKLLLDLGADISYVGSFEVDFEVNILQVLDSF